MLADMKETQLELPDQLHALLTHEAARRGMTTSELALEAISHHLGIGGRRSESSEPGHGGRHLLGERIEKALGRQEGPDPTRHHVADNIESARKRGDGDH